MARRHTGCDAALPPSATWAWHCLTAAVKQWYPGEGRNTMNRYLIVHAKSHDEGVRQSPFFSDQQAVVSQIRCLPNNDGTWSVWAEYELVEVKPVVSNRLARN